jgi:hypothetical protein
MVSFDGLAGFVYCWGFKEEGVSKMTKLLENLNLAIITGLVLTVIVAFVGPWLAGFGVN